MGDFEGRVVLITGAGRGIGRVLACAFARQGAIIAANDISPMGLGKTLAEIASLGSARAGEYLFDVAKRMPVQAMVDQVLEEWGRIDILINNAAVEPVADILDMDEWDWQRTLEVNLGGPFFTMQHAGRAMRTQGGGVIVNIAAAEPYLYGRSRRAAFSAGKAGLIGLTRYAAQELAPYNIRVLAVCPTAVDTESLRLAKDFASQPPPLPLLQAEEVAEVVLALCRPTNTESGKVVEVKPA